jgi:hypothetical protein
MWELSFSMEPPTCPNCGERVVPSSDGICPSCRSKVGGRLKAESEVGDLIEWPRVETRFGLKDLFRVTTLSGFAMWWFVTAYPWSAIVLPCVAFVVIPGFFLAIGFSRLSVTKAACVSLAAWIVLTMLAYAV